MALKNLLGDLSLEATQLLLLARFPTALDPDGNFKVQLDAGEQILTPVTSYITSATTTIIHTPSPGNRIELRWIYALNHPGTLTPSKITVKLGTLTLYDTFGISKRQKFLGGVDETLTVITDTPGPVVVSALLKEV